MAYILYHCIIFAVENSHLKGSNVDCLWCLRNFETTVATGEPRDWVVKKIYETRNLSLRVSWTRGLEERALGVTAVVSGAYGSSFIEYYYGLRTKKLELVVSFLATLLSMYGALCMRKGCSCHITNMGRQAQAGG